MVKDEQTCYDDVFRNDYISEYNEENHDGWQSYVASSFWWPHHEEYGHG